MREPYVTSDCSGEVVHIEGIKFYPSFFYDLARGFKAGSIFRLDDRTVDGVIKIVKIDDDTPKLRHHIFVLEKEIEILNQKLGTIRAIINGERNNE